MKFKLTLTKDIITRSLMCGVITETTKREWVFYKNINFDDPSFNCISIDTRDFHAIIDNVNEKIDLHKTRKYPNLYFHTKEETITLLDRYYEESGGESDWRMFMLIGEGEFRTKNWQLKYIRIYRLEQGFIIYNEQEKFIFSKKTLACSVNQEHLYLH